MTPEQQRIKIAEACGWVWNDDVYKCGDGDWSTPDGTEQEDMRGATKEAAIEYLPDYLNDLNACHEMEKTMTAGQCGNYDYLLGRYVADDNVVADSWRWHSSPAQRCEAFLKTLGLWEQGG